jgi:hypothetical protein
VLPHVKVSCADEVPEELTVFTIGVEVNSVYVLIKNTEKMTLIEVIPHTFN